MSDDLELPELSRLEAVSIQPGDVLVLTIPRQSSHEAIEHFVQELRHRFPDNESLVVVDAKLEVVRGQRWNVNSDERRYGAPMNSICPTCDHPTLPEVGNKIAVEQLCKDDIVRAVNGGPCGRVTNADNYGWTLVAWEPKHRILPYRHGSDRLYRLSANAR